MRTAECSASVASASYTFSCNSSRGAVAVLGASGHQRWYLRNRSFRQYTATHHAAWCAFAAARDHDVAPDALVLVSGWLKTSEWALATFANYGRAQDVALKACAGSYASATFEVSAGTEVQMSVEQRSGSSKDSSTATGASFDAAGGTLPRNQCLFIRYYKMKARKLGRPQVSIRADAKDIQGPCEEAGGRPRGNSRASSNDSSSSSVRSWFTQYLGGSGYVAA